MKADKRENLYRFRTNMQESDIIESRYRQSECASLSEFFRQAILNDMVLQSSETELQNISLLLEQAVERLQFFSDTEDKRILEVKREVDAAWQQLLFIQSTLRNLKH